MKISLTTHDPARALSSEVTSGCSPNRNAGHCSRAVDVCGRPSKWMDAAISELFAPGAGMACTTSRHIGMAAASIIFHCCSPARVMYPRGSQLQRVRDGLGRVIYSTTGLSHDLQMRVVLGCGGAAADRPGSSVSHGPRRYKRPHPLVRDRRHVLAGLVGRAGSGS